MAQSPLGTEVAKDFHSLNPAMPVGFLNDFHRQDGTLISRSSALGFSNHNFDVIHGY